MDVFPSENETKRNSVRLAVWLPDFLFGLRCESADKKPKKKKLTHIFGCCAFFNRNIKYGRHSAVLKDLHDGSKRMRKMVYSDDDARLCVAAN